MSSLSDAFRNILIQHLAAGGSAEEAHDALTSVAPPPATAAAQRADAAFAKPAESHGIGAYGRALLAGPPVVNFADIAGTGKGLAQYRTDLAAAQQADAAQASPAATPAASPAAPPAAGPAQVASMAPPAPPLPGAPGETPALTPAQSASAHIQGMFGSGPDYGALGVQDVRASRAHEAGMLNANARLGDAADAEGQAKAEELRLKGEQLGAEAPIREQQTSDAMKHADAVAEITRAGQQRIQAQMARYQAASDEAAQTQVHNFFDDKTTGASIMAIISQALAGAANGLAGNPGAPTPLDRIIQRDMEMQKLNLDQKNKNADRQGNMLGVLREELGSNVLAENAYYQASLTKTEAMIKQLAPYYAGGINSAQAQQALAQIQEKKAQAQQQAQAVAMQTDATRGESELRAQEAKDASMAASFASMARMHGKEQQDFGARGFSGTLPKASKDSYDKLQANHYAIQGVLEQYEDILKQPYSEENYNRIKALEPTISLVLHNTGFSRPQQLDDMVNKIAPGQKTAATNWMDARGRMHMLRQDYADVYRGSVLGLNPYSRDNPDGLKVDLSDPVMGDLWNESDTRRHVNAQVYP